MHENTQKRMQTALLKNAKPNENMENIIWIPCYNCSPISSSSFLIPNTWSIVIFHDTCLIHSNYSTHTKLVKKFPRKQLFTEKHRNTEPIRFHRSTLFSANFYKMTALSHLSCWAAKKPDHANELPAGLSRESRLPKSRAPRVSISVWSVYFRWLLWQ